jgi:protein SCO1/2
MDTAVVRKDHFIERLVMNKLFWLVFCMFFFAYPVVRSMFRELPPEQAVLFQLPEYNLTDENGKPFGSNDLKGKIYIASFHFTSCPTICPKLMKTLQKVQKRIKGVGQAGAIVSYTVDPQTDTPEVLFKKAREVKANPYVWKFLTGTKEDLKKLLIDGFKVPMGEQEAYETNLYDIAHTGKLVLVDAEGKVRGYYSTDRVDIDKLMIDMGLLINKRNFKFKDKES